MDVDAQAVETRSRSTGCALVTTTFKNILVIQTAFIGDAILTLPLVQQLKKALPDSILDVVAAPRTMEIFATHPSIRTCMPYDKRGGDKGAAGFMQIRKRLSSTKYDLIIVPHRSLRSALLAWSLRPAVSIGFDRSAGKYLFKHIVPYDPSAHEIDRNLSLLAPLEILPMERELPRLYPSVDDVRVVDFLLNSYAVPAKAQMVALAPGSIWNTKRWPAERFSALCAQLATRCQQIVLLGGREDTNLCQEIKARSGAANVISIAGQLSLLQSAELIRRTKVLISNDSAPMHIGVAMETPVVAIFGATVPEFGFAPSGPRDHIVETKGLRCRPCGIHGGEKCPIGTFECMLAISPERVRDIVLPFLAD